MSVTARRARHRRTYRAIAVDPSCGEPLRGSQRDRRALPVAAEASPGPRYCLTIPTLPVKVTVPQPGKSAEVLVSDTLFRTVTLAV